MLDRTKIKKILVIRTDRIGDVVLSTPIIRVLRENFKDSFIAMMVSPKTKDLVSENPYLDEVITYDKDNIHKNIWSSIKFAFYLKRKKIDIVLILHPTNRVNIITFLAGIPMRVGFDRKCGFLLTHKIPDEKYLGIKHEMEYNLDVLRRIGIEVDENFKTLFVPIRKENEAKIEKFFMTNKINKSDILIGIHPGASCPSKRWMTERFAKLADILIRDFNAKIVIVTGKSDIEIGRAVANLMQNRPIVALGTLSLGELVCLIKHLRIFISNDSGPVHIASSVGTPVISIFGRNQKGLSPNRWRPLGKEDIYIHKEVGCQTCLAHNCNIGFKCLKEISVSEVLDAVKKLSKYISS
ncbi:MAG: lipopolysaccharide heptosyltransferase II [Candidatus Omnitrophica bacterium]|nr:lipopolysaccharide heptosyltransferase II [Candidatus Omnitrophota bacterium]